MIKRALVLLIGLYTASPLLGQSDETMRSLTEASAQLADANKPLRSWPEILADASSLSSLKIPDESVEN